METKEIQKAVAKMLVLKLHYPVIENIRDIINRWEFDVLSINKQDMVCEFEVKKSRYDFLNDKKKGTYSIGEKFKTYNDPKNNYNKIPNYFSYVCPVNLINKNEIPHYSGLYYITDNMNIVEILKPKKIHDHKHNKDEIMRRSMILLQQRFYLGTSMMIYLRKNI